VVGCHRVCGAPALCLPLLRDDTSDAPAVLGKMAIPQRTSGAAYLAAGWPNPVLELDRGCDIPDGWRLYTKRFLLGLLDGALVSLWPEVNAQLIPPSVAARATRSIPSMNAAVRSVTFRVRASSQVSSNAVLSVLSSSCRTRSRFQR